MKETQLIKRYKKAVLAMKEFEGSDEKYRFLQDRLLELHSAVFYPDDITSDEKLIQTAEMREWLEQIDFEYF